MIRRWTGQDKQPKGRCPKRGELALASAEIGGRRSKLWCKNERAGAKTGAGALDLGALQLRMPNWERRGASFGAPAGGDCLCGAVGLSSCAFGPTVPPFPLSSSPRRRCCHGCHHARGLGQKCPRILGPGRHLFLFLSLALLLSFVVGGLPNVLLYCSHSFMTFYT